jgi:Nuclease-related domain
VPAADGVDARARRVAARLLSSRSRRGAGHPGRPGLDNGQPRHATGGHPAGAARIAKALKALEPEGWVSLAQVRCPGTTEERRIDHLLIGPGGVVVLDSRSWVGRIEVSRGVVQQNGFWREHETAAVARVAGSVAALLQPQHRTAVHAVVCVAQHELAEQLVAPGVHVVGVSGLARALRALPPRLHPAEVLHLNTMLRATLLDGAAVEQLTTAELEDGALTVDVPGAHREPAAGAPRLFVPVTGSTLRTAPRTAARRQRPPRPWWRTPRVVVPRALLAVLLLTAAVLAGPGVVRALDQALNSTPAPTEIADPVQQVPTSPAGGRLAGTPTGDVPTAGHAASSRPVRSDVWVEPAATTRERAGETG